MVADIEVLDIIAPGINNGPDEIPVSIILPTRWFGQVMYRLAAPVVVAGETVPANYKTDGFTTPFLLRLFCPAINKYLKAAILHDFKLDAGHGWRASNASFRRALRELGAGWLVVGTMGALTGAWGCMKVAFFGEKA